MFGLLPASSYGYVPIVEIAEKLDGHSVASTTERYLSNRDLGFLLGDIDAKLDPFMQSLYDNLAVKNTGNGNSTSGVRNREFLQSNQVEVTPLAYIRAPRLLYCG